MYCINFSFGKICRKDNNTFYRISIMTLQLIRIANVTITSNHALRLKLQFFISETLKSIK